MQRLIAAVCLVAVLCVHPARAEQDSPASYLASLFGNACIQNNDDPDKITAWAAEHKLRKVADPATRALFIGKDGKGEAWSVVSASGRFALSIRGGTGGCAVWAHEAGAAEVEKYFKQIIQSLSGPGIHIEVVHDTTSDSPSGKIRNLIFQATSDDKHADGFAFTMLTMEDPGNTFQATLQEARFTPQ